VAGGVFRGEDCIATAEMPVVQLKGNDPWPYDEDAKRELEPWKIREQK